VLHRLLVTLKPAGTWKTHSFGHPVLHLLLNNVWVLLVLHQ